MPQFTKYALENSLKKLLLQKPGPILSWIYNPVLRHGEQKHLLNTIRLKY